MKKAQWIWISQGKCDEYAVFVDEFNLSKTQNVFMDVSVFGDYTLYLNGQMVAFGQYADYVTHKVYDKLNISQYVNVGKNSLKLVCWHMGKSFSVYKEAGSGVIFELYQDGKVLLCSNQKTKCALAKDYISYKCKAITAQLGFSYTYDTRFQKAEYDYQNAVLVKGVKDIFLRPNQKTVLKELTPAKIIDKEKKIYDLGRECCGFLDITFKANNGENVKVAYGEHVDDGDVRHYIDGRDFTVDLIGSGQKTEFLGTFKRLGCRYLKIIGEAEIFSIGLREVVYPLSVKPFDIKDQRRKQIYLTSLKTLELCMHEHYEDCPWREQSMYIMDSRNQMRCGYYAFDNPEFALASIRLMAEGQKDNGLFDLCFPSEISITIPSFALTFPSVVYEYAVQDKSNQIIKEMMPKIEKMMAYFLDNLDANGLYKTVGKEGIWNFYEWADDLYDSAYNPDVEQELRNEYDVLFNAFISLACAYCAKLCTLNMDYKRGFEFEKIREGLNDAIRKTFFVEEKGLFKTREQTEQYSALANALCILSGACKKEHEGFIADKLAYGAEWVENTLSMNLFRFDALIKVDKNKYKDIILEEIDKVYGYMLDKGATSFWETIIGADDFHFAGSLCHGWSAIPVYYYRILGVAGEQEKDIDEIFEFRNFDMRTDYASSVQNFIDKTSVGCENLRDKYLYAEENFKRKELVKMIGFPLSDKEKWQANLVKTERIFCNEHYKATRYYFEINGINFGGILYEKPNSEKISRKDAFLLACHGGGGTPEIVGDLFLESANYNNMITRTLRDNLKIFVPQLLLWNVDVYESDYNREIMNRRLVQLGGSMTALELKLLISLVDFWSKFCDKTKMGVLGLSYGGMYALHLGAVDKRIKTAYSSCWFSDRAKHNWHDWTYLNAQNKFFDSEIASLVLPRKLFIEVGEKDNAFPASDCKNEKSRLESYALRTGNTDSLKFKIFDGEHELDKNGELLNEFMNYLCE